MPPNNQANTGHLFVIVGPSGVGKDSLLAYARKRLTHLRFVQRYITRPANSGGENHIPLTATEFETMATAGEFCVWWRAHELAYGIHTDVKQWVGGGQSAVVNGSRAVIADFEQVFPNTTVVHINASKRALRSRLLRRGRENVEQIEARLNRPAPPLVAKRLVEIDNSGRLVDAAEKLIHVLTFDTEDTLLVSDTRLL